MPLEFSSHIGLTSWSSWFLSFLTIDLSGVGTGRSTDTLDEEDDGGGISQPSSALLQACGPREPHPRQVDFLLDNGMAVTCVKYNGRPQIPD